MGVLSIACLLTLLLRLLLRLLRTLLVGTAALIRVGRVLTVEGATINVILLNGGQAVLATPATLEALGASAAAVTSLAGG